MNNTTVSWSIPADHPAFAGHFPGNPIVPGVLLLDAMLHAIAATGVTMNTCEIRSIKFLAPARPGESLRLEHAALPGGAIRFEFVAAHDQRLIASGTVAPASHGVDSPGTAA